MRAIVADVDVAGAMERTQQLVKSSGRVHCYRTVYGGHRVLWPGWGRPHEIDAAVPRLTAFRDAVLSHSLGAEWAARAAAAPAPPSRIVFVLRKGSRALLNEDALIANVSADPQLRDVVDFRRLEEMSVVEQIRLVATSAARQQFLQSVVETSRSFRSVVRPSVFFQPPSPRPGC